jgi:hypothetical protein
MAHVPRACATGITARHVQIQGGDSKKILRNGELKKMFHRKEFYPCGTVGEEGRSQEHAFLVALLGLGVHALVGGGIFF